MSEPLERIGVGMGANLTREAREARWAKALEMRAQGMTHVQIAAALGISKHVLAVVIRQAVSWQERQKHPDTIAELSTRARTCLRNMGAHEHATRQELSSLLAQREADSPHGLGLLGYKNLGRATLAEIQNWLEQERGV